MSGCSLPVCALLFALVSRFAGAAEGLAVMRLEVEHEVGCLRMKQFVVDGCDRIRSSW